MSLLGALRRLVSQAFPYVSIELKNEIAAEFFLMGFINVNKKLSVENIKRLSNICITLFLEKAKIQMIRTPRIKYLRFEVKMGKQFPVQIN